MMEAIRVLYFFVFAMVVAAVEVEIEGPYGWAERLPTWYRTKGTVGRLYAALLNGKPLTGYHLLMFTVPLFVFHLPFFEGKAWTWGAEAQVLSTLASWMIVWDFLWFLLNPAYGWRRFRSGNIWWHNRRWIWRLPLDYYAGIAASLAVAATGWFTTGNLSVLEQHIKTLTGFVLLTLITLAIAPAYHRWYLYMRRPGMDDRHNAGIFHR